MKIEQGINTNTILFASQPMLAVGIVLDNSAKDSSGVCKAGMPLTGDLKARTTAFTKASTSTGSNAVGILLHDVVFDGENDANATLLIIGAVNISKVDSTTAANITADVISALPAIKFLK